MGYFMDKKLLELLKKIEKVEKEVRKDRTTPIKWRRMKIKVKVRGPKDNG